MDDDKADTVEMAVELTVAWLGNASNRVTPQDVPAFLSKIHHTLSALSGARTIDAEEAAPAKEYTPATTARKSLASPDHIISMIDGKPYKTLRRHLSTNGMTPEQYRERYNLKADYPMVAPGYSEVRKAMAHKIGLGRNREQTDAPTDDVPAKAPQKSARDAVKDRLDTAE